MKVIVDTAYIRELFWRVQFLRIVVVMLTGIVLVHLPNQASFTFLGTAAAGAGFLLSFMLTSTHMREWNRQIKKLEEMMLAVSCTNPSDKSEQPPPPPEQK